MTVETYTVDNSTQEERPQLSLWDSICLIIGIIIGASIYHYPPSIFASAGGAIEGMIAWFAGGVISLVGALCYAELATTYRAAGGDYTYLTKAYGPRIGFIFAWAELSVIRTGGSIACMAYIFAHYATVLYPLGPHSTLTYAISSVLGLTILNTAGVRPGRIVQNVLTVSNFVGLAGICLIALWASVFHPPIPAVPVEARAAEDIESVSLALMMVFVFYAYGGWNEAAFISSEVKNPKRNIRRALLIGTSLVMLLYMAVNLAYLSTLGFDFVCKTKLVAMDMYAIPFGEAGRTGICVLVMLSALGSINGLLFTGMRLYGTFGADHKFFTWLAGKGGHHVAYGALFAQAAFSFLLIAVVESAMQWRKILAEIAPYFNMQLTEEFHKAGDIERIVTCTAPVFWIFFLLTGCSLFILRIKDPDRERPVRVPFYPIMPLIFCASCAFMLYRSGMWALKQEPAEALIVASLMLLGIPLCFLSGRAAKRAQEQKSESEFSTDN